MSRVKSSAILTANIAPGVGQTEWVIFTSCAALDGISGPALPSDHETFVHTDSVLTLFLASEGLRTTPARCK